MCYFTAGDHANPPIWPRRTRWCVSLAVLILVVRIFRASSVFTGRLDMIQEKCGSQDGASLTWSILACGFAAGIYHGYHLRKRLPHLDCSFHKISSTTSVPSYDVGDPPICGDFCGVLSKSGLPLHTINRNVGKAGTWAFAQTL